MRRYLSVCLISCLLTGCKSTNEPPPFNLAEEFSDHYDIPFDKDFSGGYTWIDSGFVFSQISHKKYDIKKILIADIKKKISYGSFRWPDNQGSYYFSCGYWNNKMIYLNRDNFIYTTNLSDKVTDTIPTKTEFDFVNDFVMSGNNLVSINNIYGIEAINILKTDNRIFLRPYRGHHFYRQNNISLPVAKDLNLVGSTDKNDSLLTVYAIDSSLVIRWQKDLRITDRTFEIKSYSFKNYFLIKYEKTIECLSKAGVTVWSKTFDKKVLNYFPINEHELLIVFTDFGNEIGGTPNNSFNFNVSMYEVSADSIKWRKNIFFMNRSVFIGKKFIYSFDKNLRCNKIDIETGTNQELPVSGEVEVLRDKITGENYLLYDKTLYW